MFSNSPTLKVSVAVCTYNGEKFLKDQLNSIVLQSRTVDEIVICDDGSQDQTIKILEEFAVGFSSKVKLYQNEVGLGPVKNFEKAISLTTGDIIFLSDQDDLWLPKKVETILSFLESNKTALLVFSDGMLIDDKGNITGGTLWDKWGFDLKMQKKWRNNTRAFADLLDNCNKITGATIAFKSSLKAHIFPFNLPHLYYHDAWLGLIASAHNGLRFINKPLINYRVHSNQQVGIGTGVAINNSQNKDVLEDYISYELFHKKVFQLFPNFKPSLKKNLLLSFARRVKTTIRRF